MLPPPKGALTVYGRLKTAPAQIGPVTVGALIVCEKPLLTPNNKNSRENPAIWE